VHLKFRVLELYSLVVAKGGAAELGAALRVETALGQEESFQVYLLVSYSLGLLLLAKGIFQMAFPGLGLLRCVEMIAAGAAFLLTSILYLDALFNGGVFLGDATPILPVLVLGCCPILVAAQVCLLLPHAGRGKLALLPVVSVSVALALVTTAWSSQRYNSGTLSIQMGKSLCVLNGERQEIRDLVAVTDRGREVKLYRWAKDDDSHSPSSVQLASENILANCHGWVFTGGKHILGLDGVARILEDNGYRECEVPHPGDLIVYRDDRGEILHTGLVRAGLFGGMLIESKWGLEGRFVHEPNQQPYGNRFTYYRSSRQGHALATRAARPSMTIVDNRQTRSAGLGKRS
jgi:hypothetical protein